MKQVVFGLVCTLLMTFILVIVMTVYGRNLRQSEVDHSLAEAVDTAMENLMTDQEYTIGNSNAFVADFLQLLVTQLNSTSDVTVSVLEADENLGILSVEVTEKYKHPNGNEGSVSEVRTVILDKKQEEIPVQHVVEFFTGDDILYKRYTLPENSMCSIPTPPKKEGKIFSHWRFVTGGSGKAEKATVAYPGGSGSREVLAAGGAPMVVTEDTQLIAVFQ